MNFKTFSPNSIPFMVIAKLTFIKETRIRPQRIRKKPSKCLGLFTAPRAALVNKTQISPHRIRNRFHRCLGILNAKLKEDLATTVTCFTHKSQRSMAQKMAKHTTKYSKHHKSKQVYHNIRSQIRWISPYKPR
jgi:hypothetical protein